MIRGQNEDHSARASNVAREARVLPPDLRDSRALPAKIVLASSQNQQAGSVRSPEKFALICG